jgi:hypothetical protein
MMSARAQGEAHIRHPQFVSSYTNFSPSHGIIATRYHDEHAADEYRCKPGETAAHTVATMHEIRDGLVYRWSDYWDMQRFISQFPAWFIAQMGKASAYDFTD